MKKVLSILAVVTLLVGLAGMAQAYTITDEYVGEDDHGYGDVIGDVNDFGIDEMEVELVGTDMTVKIKTGFTEGEYFGQQIDFGDLFISTNGWTPEETWEYVFDVSEGELYNIQEAQGQILLAEDVMGSGVIYRNGQEVLIDNDGLDSIGAGGTAGRDGEYYVMSFDISELALDPAYKLGFHWGMTCANDVIEGEFDPAIPEPSTVLLLGAGLLGIVGIVGRKRNKK